MAISLTTRSGEGSELTTAQVDTNWTDIQSAVNTNETNITTAQAAADAAADDALVYAIVFGG